VSAFVSPVSAQSNTTGPTVSIDRSEAAPGDSVIVTVAGFDARPVTISVCGNEARRGSVDCDMRGSRARETQPDGPIGTDLTVSAPPTPCPCIVRVSTQDNRMIAVAPIVIIGHPVAEVVGASPADQPLLVDIVANPASTGVSDQLRSSLGGPTSYDVTVRVTNTATFEIADVAVAATFTLGRFDDTRNIDVPNPGPLAAGQTWEETVPVDVPALTFGDVGWSATASGQGPAVTASDSTSSRPVLLYVVGAILLVDLTILLWRVVARVRRRDEGDWEPHDNPFLDDSDAGAVEVDHSDTTRQQPQFIG
jgi:hypothetical protein